MHAELKTAALAFPPELRTVRPAPEEWCAMELLGHVAEMHYSYVARARNLMASPGAELARDMESPERLEGIERGRHATVEAAFASLDEAREHVVAFLEELTEDQSAIQGHHRALGPMTVKDVLERTIVGHARNHLGQLRETFRQVTKSAQGSGQP